MPKPRVFVSSTWYDLRDIRVSTEELIKNMGMEPVLSERGNVFYDPTLEVKQACIDEVSNCQMLVLIIGGRFGSKFKDQSIVNYEYRTAVEKKIPVFALVEQNVYVEFFTYLKNKGKHSQKINYASVDSSRIFEFMSEVMNNTNNNALQPFSQFSEIESYLKQQWASLLYSFLSKKIETERLKNMLESITGISNKIEFLSKQILSSVGQQKEKLNALLYDKLYNFISDEKIDRLSDFQFSPKDTVKNERLEHFLLEGKVAKTESKKSLQSLIYLKGEKSGCFVFTVGEYDNLRIRYQNTRQEMLNKITEYGFTVKDYLDKTD